MTEHKCNKESEIDEIKNGIKEILKLLNGNGKIGICAKIQIVWVGLTIVSATLATLVIREVWAHWVG